MPLNYSKWDALELSDDSDIEGHPNVDKKSLIRWQQRAIHEKREARNNKIHSLEAEIACNRVLAPRLREVHASLLSPPSTSASALSYFNELVDALRRNPKKDKPPGNAPNQPTYDQMILNLLLQLPEDDRVKSVSDSGDEVKAKALADALDIHIGKLEERTRECERDVEEERREQRKHITSEDIRDGFDTHYVPPKPAPAALANTKGTTTKETKTKTEYETLNPKDKGKGKAKSKDSSGEEEGEGGLPEMTPRLTEFSQLPLWAYQQSFSFIQAHREVVVPGASDALLVAAFRAQKKKDKDSTKYAKQCVHQSLLLQYCEKLGGDGVGMFFKKMITGDVRAKGVFEQDVEKTYAHLVERVRISSEEEEAAGETSGGRETIQLVPENPDQAITFNVPDGPPPSNLVLEGPGTEGMDIEEVRRMLQFRWDVYDAFPEELKVALNKGELEAVNAVLGEMEVAEAEGVVDALNEAGIMSFAEGGVIQDQT